MDSTVDGGAGAVAKAGLVGKRARRRARAAMEMEMDLRREERGFGGEGFWGFRKWKGIVGFLVRDGRRGCGDK